MKNSVKITVRRTCRVCRSSKLEYLYSLGELYISNFVKPHEAGIKAPLEMILCKNCTLVQLRHTAPQELLYARYYWYRSGVTDTMKKALRDITEEIERLVDLKRGDIVLDIGSNDGTLLRSYSFPGLVKVGFEPALNLKKEGERGVDIFVSDFWSAQLYKKKVKKGFLQGLLLGVIFAVTGIILDAIITVPFMQMNYGFLIRIDIVLMELWGILLCGLVGMIRK